MKRKIAAVLTLALALSGLTGSLTAVHAEENDLSGSKITVLMPKHEMDTIGFYETKTREFEEETGIKVELINMGWDNVAERVTAEMTSGGSSYDVIEFDNSWVAKFGANDWLYPLDEYITDEMKEGIVPALLEKFTYDGKLYGICWNNDTRFLMYNKAMLDEAGIEAPARTYDELIEQTKAMQEAGICEYGYIDSYMQAQSGFNEFCQLVYSFGGKYLDDDGNPIMDSDPGLKAAYEYLVQAYNDGIYDPSALMADYDTVANVFYSGSTAYMLQAWAGIYASSNDESISTIPGQVEVADYSISADGETQAVLTLPEAMAIPKTSENKDAAWKYIEFMSSKEFDKEKSKAIGALPIWSDLFQDEELLAEYPYWEQFGKQSEFAKGEPDILWFDEFSNIVQIETQNIILGTNSVEDGLAAMQEQCLAAMK